MFTYNIGVSFFFLIDTATTEIYTLSLHDALPIYSGDPRAGRAGRRACDHRRATALDRKSTRLNSSHEWSSYAVFCLNKKKTIRAWLRWWMEASKSAATRSTRTFN